MAAIASCRGMRMSNGTLNSEPDLASIPMAQGGLTRLAIARLESAGVPVAPILRRVGLTSELVADPEERLSRQREAQTVIVQSNRRLVQKRVASHAQSLLRVGDKF